MTQEPYVCHSFVGHSCIWVTLVKFNGGNGLLKDYELIEHDEAIILSAFYVFNSLRSYVMSQIPTLLGLEIMGVLVINAFYIL